MQTYPPSAMNALTGFERKVLETADEWFQSTLADPSAEESAAQTQQVGDEIYENLLMLCMTPRSGSSALSSALGKTDALGLGGERLNRKPGGPLDVLLDGKKFPSKVALLDEVVCLSCTSNGVAQIKCDFPQIYPFLADPECARKLRKAKFVYLTREDVLSQAISRYKGFKTGYWHSVDKGNGDQEVPFDFDEIRKQVLHISNMMAAYERIFATFDLRPLRITYERVVSDSADVVSKIADLLGVTLEKTVDLDAGGYKPVATTNNSELRDKFIAEFSESLRGASQ